jgi:hypothetical protein
VIVVSLLNEFKVSKVQIERNLLLAHSEQQRTSQVRILIGTGSEGNYNRVKVSKMKIPFL